MFIISGNTLNGCVFYDGVLGDHHTASMNGGMTTHTFQSFGTIDKAFGIVIGTVEIFEIGDIFERSIDRREHRDQFGDLVTKSVRHSHCPTDITNCRARCHGSESNDVRDVVPTIFFSTIGKNVISTIIGEVHINVRHRNTFGIEKSLKEQTVFDRVDVRDTHEIRHERPCCGPTSRSNNDTVVSGPVDEVLYDKEVFRVSHFFNNGKLILEALSIFWCDSSVETFFHAFLGECPKRGHRRFAFGEGVVRKLDLSQCDLKIALVGNGHGIVDRFGGVGKGLSHLLLTFDIEVKVRHGTSVILILFAVVLDAQKKILDGRVFRMNIMDIGSGHEGYFDLFGKSLEFAVNMLLFGYTWMMLELKVEIVFAKYLLVFECYSFCPGGIVFDNALRDLAFKASAQGDQSLMSLAKKFFVHAGLAEKSIQLSRSDKVHQILVSSGVGGQDCQIMDRGRVCGYVIDRERGNEEFTSDDHVHSALFGHNGELYGTVEIGILRDGDRIHSEFFDTVKNIVHLGGTFEKRVV